MLITPKPKPRTDGRSLSHKPAHVIALRRGSAEHSATVIALKAMAPLVHSDARREWVHAARVGQFNGHPSGEFEFTSKVFAKIIENFNALENRAVPLTYDHPTYDGKSPVEQAGWVHELKVTESGLWALCEFTDRAVELNRGGSYKFASVVVVFDSIDRVSGDEIGPELLELALTSAPFIDGLEPTHL